jgi:hypothetical protein
VTTVAGRPRIRGTIDGSAAEAEFIAPARLAFATNGDLYILDNGMMLRKLSTNGLVSTVSIIGSLGRPFFKLDADRWVLYTSEANRGGFAIDRSGNFYFACTMDNTIKLGSPANDGVSLTATRAGDSVQVSWPATGSNVALEASSAPHDPDSWSRVPQSIAPGFIQQTVTERRFYRLRPE